MDPGALPGTLRSLPMDAPTLLHNPRCSKSRQALELLRAHGVEPVVLRYLDMPLTSQALADLVQRLGAPAATLLRTEEARGAGFAPETMDDIAILDTIAAHPHLLQRPVLIAGDRAVIGRPPERVLTLLEPPAA
jgi:arsenate reductase